MVITLYVASFTIGVVGAITANHDGLVFLLELLVGSGAAWWVVLDARERGNPILHILQLILFLTWPIAVPLYLMTSRGFRGLYLSVAHFVGLVLIQSTGLFLAAILIHPVVKDTSLSQHRDTHQCKVKSKALHGTKTQEI